MTSVQPTSNTLRLTIKTMYMEAWIACMCEDDYSSIDNDMALWIDLVGQYQELRGDTIEAIEQLRLTKQVRLLHYHLYIFGLCVKQLNVAYSESIADTLNKLGYSFNPVVKEPDQYRNLLEMCINKSKTKYILLQQAVKQLEAAKPSDKKPKREYYEDTLLTMEQYQKVSYNLETLTVYKFCLLEKRLSRAVAKQNKNK